MTFSRYRLPIARLSCAAAFFATIAISSAEPPPSQFNWTGFYIGGNLGGGIHHFDLDTDHTTFDVARQFYATLEPTEIGINETGLAMFTTHDASDDVGSWFGGGQAGYNLQVGHFVFGIEGWFDRTGGHTSTTTTETATTLIIGGTQQFTTEGETTFTSNRYAETNFNGGGVLHLGYAHGPWLVYILGGVAFADLNVWETDRARTDFFNANNDEAIAPNAAVVPKQGQFTNFIGTVNTTTVSHDDDTLLGWLAGLGFEVAVSDSVSFGIEYRHLDYGDSNHHFTQGPQDFPGATNAGLSTDQVTFRMNILLSHLFGGGNGAVATSKISAPRNPFLSGDDVSVGYHRRTLSEGKDVMSGKDKNVALEPVEEPFQWTGFYIGGNVGGTSTDFEYHGFTTDVDVSEQFFGPNPPVASAFNTIDVPGRSSQVDDSVIGGGQMGWEHQFGAFVLGVEGDFDGLDTSKRREFFATSVIPVPATITDAVTNFDVIQRARQNWNASARLRLGWARGPVLLYATGGVAWTDAELSTDITASTDFFAFGQIFNFNTTDRSRSSTDDVETGWTAGGGAQYAFNRRVSVGLEYRHSGFDDLTDSSRLRMPIAATTRRVDLDNDQVTFRINFLLGGSH